ncbi:unnamed protein product, partial [Oppiella nova]
YKNRALLLHPDKHDDKESEELFKQLVKAKEVLTDPQMRKQYDKWRSSGIAISFEEWNRLGKGAHTSMHWRNDYKRDLMIGNGDNGDNESSDQRQHRSGSGSRVIATDWSSDCNGMLKKNCREREWRLPFFWTISGPTLSPVSSLCLMCAPSHKGNFLERQHRQNTVFAPMSSMSKESTTLSASFFTH